MVMGTPPSLQEVKALTPLEVQRSPPVPAPVCRHRSLMEVQNTLMMDLTKKDSVNSIADSLTQWMAFTTTVISSIVTLQPLSLYQRYVIIWADHRHVHVYNKLLIL